MPQGDAEAQKTHSLPLRLLLASVLFGRTAGSRRGGFGRGRRLGRATRANALGPAVEVRVQDTHRFRFPRPAQTAPSWRRRGCGSANTSSGNNSPVCTNPLATGRPPNAGEDLGTRRQCSLGIGASRSGYMSTGGPERWRSAAPTLKKTFGFHPTLAFCDNTGEFLAASLRRGNAGRQARRRPHHRPGRRIRTTARPPTLHGTRS